MKKIFSLICFLLICYIAGAQKGAPLLSHFRESREIENQSWAICQDENEVMLFANRRGIMTFDGQIWNFIIMPSVPYSIKYSSGNKKIYTGCNNNYGYLQKDEKGIYKYYSLSGDTARIGLITNILFTDSTVCFYGESTISRHNLKTGKLERRFISKVNAPFSGMFITPKNTFINVTKEGLYRIEADTLFPIVTGYLLKDDEVLFSLPYNSKLVLLGLSNGSLSLFDGIKFYDYQIKDEGYIKENILSDGIIISDSLYAFSTLDGGAIVVGKNNGKLIQTINYQNGLPDDEVFAMGSDNKNGLWLSHQYGLTRADLLLPVLNFGIYPGLKGNLITSLWHDKELYVATSEGVYYLTYIKNYKDVDVLVKREQIKIGLNIPINSASPVQQKTADQKTKKTLLSRIFGKKPPVDADNKPDTVSMKQFETVQSNISRTVSSRYVRQTVSKLKSINYMFKKVDGLNEKCKQMVSTPFGILAASNKGLYNISSHSAKLFVKDVNINFISKKTDDDKYYLATSAGYFYISAESERWNTCWSDSSFTQPLYSIIALNDNILWAGGNSVAYKIIKNQTGAGINYKEYTVRNDFPNKYIVEQVNDTVFLLTESGIRFYDEINDDFKDYGKVAIRTGSKLNFIYSQPETPWYKDGDDWLCLAYDIKFKGNDQTFLKIFDEIISITMSDRFLWVVTGDNQLFRITPTQYRLIDPDLDLHIRSITNEDGLYFNLSDIVFERGDNTVYFDLVAPGYIKQNSTQYQYLLGKTMTDWSKWSTSSTITLMLSPGNYSLQVRAKDLWGNISDPKNLNFTIRAPFTQTTGFYVIVLFLFLFIIFFIIRFREGRLRKEKQILEQKVKERTVEIESQKEAMTSSIEYASRIQMAMLPIEDHFNEYFSDHFIIFRPRDIVSGDFFWIGEDDRHVFFTVADCTGHGVPGAFMSTLGISTLNEIIKNNNDLQANTILNLLREKIITSLHQTGKQGEAADGMDIAFCILHKDRMKLEFSGAFMPLFVFLDGEFKEYKADRMPIGIHYGKKESFTNYEINIERGDTLYIFSDGLVDQFGGPNNRKYRIANMRKLLEKIHSKPMAEQSRIIEKEFMKWKGQAVQVDDITMVGVRI